MMRRVAFVLAGAILAALAVVAAGAAWLRGQEPVAALPRQRPGELASVVELRQERWRDRKILHVALDGGAIGRVRFVVSLPDPLPDHPVPVVIVLGGMGAGSDAIRELTEVGGDPGPNAIIGYDWPLPRRLPGLLEMALRAPALRRQALSVPGQVDALLRWASQEPWADTARVSLLGFSFGAFAAPAVQRLAEERGASVRWTVLGYSGAPIGAVIAGHPKVRPRWLASGLGSVADLLLRPVEPSFHLPHLHGHFLVVEAGSDRLIAPAAAERVRELTPQPRSVVLVEGDHMGIGPNTQGLLRQVIEVTRAWLVAQGGLDPRRPRGRSPGSRHRSTAARSRASASSQRREICSSARRASARARGSISQHRSRAGPPSPRRTSPAPASTPRCFAIA